MQKFISDIYSESDLKIITPNDGKHYFFAYYDMRATGKNGKHWRGNVYRLFVFKQFGFFKQRETYRQYGVCLLFGY